MILGVGWCVLRTSRSAYASALPESARDLDAVIDASDAELWVSFRKWMAANESPWLLWTLHEHHNNHNGMLQVYLSRNHRSSPFWAMLGWIAEHGRGSFGLFYVHDDEDAVGPPYERKIPEDYVNVFRVHRIMNGRVEELPDPFFGPLVPSLEPMHPYDRDDDSDGPVAGEFKGARTL